MSSPNSNNNNSNASNTSPGAVTYESCVALLTGGKPVTDLPAECQKILGHATSALVRRTSGAWSSKAGHDARNFIPGNVGGPAFDEVKKENEMSISEIFLQNKSPEDQRVIKQKIARTASRGGKVRSEELISPEDVERERIKLAEEKAKIKESHPKV